MPSNKYTTQPPKSGASTKTVLAERAYVHTVNTAYADPGAKLDGADPAGWTDLGIVAGSKVQLNYTKEVKYVETGIEKVRRGSYVMGKSAQAVFTLEQYDVDIIEILTAQTATAVGGIGGKLYIGQDDIVEKALLFVGTNKVDGKEHHIYCKKAGITWQTQEQDDARVIQVTADLYAFDPGNGLDAFFVWYVLD